MKTTDAEAISRMNVIMGQAKLDEAQLSALDLIETTAAQNLDTDDQATLAGIADVIAGRVYTQEEFMAETQKVIDELKSIIDER